MEGIHGVYFGERLCGKVQVQKENLYYRIICRCKINSELVCRLRVQFENGMENVGILTPVEDGFGLCTRLPVKRFLDKPIKFVLTPVSEGRKGQYIPILPEEPFGYIEKLKTSYLAKKDGSYGVLIG